MSKMISLQQRVRYAETDQMGIVYYANYLVWFECGRSHYMRTLGMPYTMLEERGIFFPVTAFQGRLVTAAHYDEAIDIHTSISALKSRQVTYVYEVMREGQLLAEGTTTHVCVNAQHHPVRLPEWLREVLAQ